MNKKDENIKMKDAMHQKRVKLTHTKRAAKGSRKLSLSWCYTAYINFHSYLAELQVFAGNQLSNIVTLKNPTVCQILSIIT